MIADLRYALRALLRAPGFAVPAVLVLAGGIALATAGFSLVRGYLFSPLPYPDPDRVVSIIAARSDDFALVPRGLERLDFSRLDDVFAQTALWDLDGFTVVSGERPDYVDGAWVNPGFFAIAGARAAQGRLFTDDDVRTGARVAVISDAFRSRHFGPGATALGSTLRAFSTDRPLEAESYTIVGVLPAGFWHVNRFTDILLPLRAPRLVSLALLAPGVTADQARQRLDRLARETFPEAHPDWGFRVVPAREQHTRDARPAVLILFAAVACVLLVAVANVAGLMALRGMSRLPELSVRAALGAGRGRLIRQQVAEGLVLAALAGALGLALSSATVAWLAPWLQTQLGVTVPGGVSSLRLDPAMAAGALLAALLLGALVSLQPALGMARLDLAGAIGWGRSVAGGRGRFRAALVAGQVALTFMLLVGAGLMVRTLFALNNTELGFHTDGVLKAHLLVPRAPYPDAAARTAVVSRILEQIRAVPGVEQAAIVQPHPFRFGGSSALEPEGYAGSEAGAPRGAIHQIHGDYFDALAVPLLEGRAFTTADVAGSAPVAIVSAGLARLLWPGQGALGRRVRLQPPGLVTAEPEPWRTVVGVVGDVRKSFIGQAVGDVYAPYTQTAGGYFAILARTSGAPETLARPVQDAVLRVGADLPLHEVEPLGAVIDRSGRSRRFLATLLGVFSALTLGLAMVGLFSVLSFAVRRRSRELAVRIAVGAAPARIARLVLKEALLLAVAGVIFGAFGARALAGLVSSQLYGVEPLDTASFAAAALTLVLVALLAAAAPVWRAIRLQPAAILRTE